jgi:hypothetical protein
MNNSKKKIKFHLNGITFSDTTFICENKFSSDELNKFSKIDCEKIWLPDGIPFLGEFDLYIKVFKNKSFQGFFRIEIFPWKEINLHIAFPTSNSFKSRYYLKTTSFFLFMLKDLKYEIYCLVNNNNTNVMKYMIFFDFKFVKQENEILRFKFENLNNLNLFNF